jgi:hypothetical protein
MFALTEPKIILSVLHCNIYIYVYHIIYIYLKYIDVNLNLADSSSQIYTRAKKRSRKIWCESLFKSANANGSEQYVFLLTCLHVWYVQH